MPKIKEKYVLMAEPDHLFIRAPPLWAETNRWVGQAKWRNTVLFQRVEC